MNPPSPSSATPFPSADPPAGLLVVTVDRLPAWMLSSFGATWVATPALDSLAARGLVFDRVLTPSLAVHDTLRELATASPEGRSLFRAAAAAGWRSVMVTDDAAVAAGLAAEVAAPAGAAVRLVEAVAKREVEKDETQTNIARLVDAAIDAVATGEHRLVWCHVGSLGVAWDAPEHHRDRYIDPEDPRPPGGASVPGFAVNADTDPDLVVGTRHVFAGQLTLLDGQLGRLFEAVGQRGQSARPWAVLVVGVRGLPLGLHGWVGVGGKDLPYGESIHVPAILVDPAGRMAAQRYGGLIVPADVGMTLGAVLAGHTLRAEELARQASEAAPQATAIDPASPWRGVSLARLFEDWSAPVRDRVVAVGPAGAAIVTPEWHGLLAAGDAAGALVADIHQGGRFRLFAKPDDSFEQADVADRCGGVADQLAELAALALRGDPQAAWLAQAPPVEGV